MKKSLISIAALGFLSIPALASSTTVQTQKVIGTKLSAEITRIGGLAATRKLVADDFIDVRPMITAWVQALDAMDPAGASEHAVATKKLDQLQVIGTDEKYKMIIDDFGDFRQTLLHVGLVSRVRAYRDAILVKKPASLQPIIDAINERGQSPLPMDARTAADRVAATEIANDLAKRVQGIPAPARKADFNFLVEVVHGQRMLQLVGVTMARRQAAGLVSKADVQHTRNLILARNAAELQLYRDAGTETTRLNTATTEMEAAAMQGAASAAPFRRHAAVGTDLNLRRSIAFLQRKSVAGAQTKVQFNRLRDLLAIRAQGFNGSTRLGRELTKKIVTEVNKVEKLAATRPLTKDDFRTFEVLRSELLSSSTEASFKK